MLDIEALKKYAKIVLVQNGLQLKEKLYQLTYVQFPNMNIKQMNEAFQEGLGSLKIATGTIGGRVISIDLSFYTYLCTI